MPGDVSAWRRVLGEIFSTNGRRAACAPAARRLVGRRGSATRPTIWKSVYNVVGRFGAGLTESVSAGVSKMRFVRLVVRFHNANEVTVMTQKHTVRATAIYIFVLLASSIGIAAENETGDGWLRGSGKDLQIRLSGEVFDADGSPATGLQVSGGANEEGGKQKFEPKISGNGFELWIPVN